jgi:nucleotide-binding universal stress UspA family protein
MVELSNILVPTDFSESAQSALDYAKMLAGEFGSRLHLLHVVFRPPIGWAAESDILPWSTLLAEVEIGAGARLDRLLPVDDPIASRLTSAVVIDRPLEGILGYVAAHHIDLIVMGTHGRGSVRHFLLGSVAERVVHSASVPVLTIHGPAASSDALKRNVKTRSRPSITVF